VEREAPVQVQPAPQPTPHPKPGNQLKTPVNGTGNK
jgi:hypothetical protein